MFLLAQRFWYEIFAQGANDMFRVALLLASLLALKKPSSSDKRPVSRVVIFGEVLPALFLVITSLRRQLNVGLVKGFVVGLIPAPGLSSGIKAVYSITRSGFVSPFHTIQPAFYSVVPPAFHFVLPLSLLLAIGMSLFRNIAEPIEYENVLVSFTLLLIMGEVTFKQMHTNHLIWFYPLFALIFTRYRHAFSAPLTGSARDPDGTD